MFAAGVAAIAFALTVPLGWVAHHVADEDGYVDFTSEVIVDPEIRDSIVQLVSDDLVARSGVSGTFAQVIRTAVERAADSVVESTAFRAAFAEVQRQSHRALFEGVPVDEETDQLVVDFAPVAQTIVDRVADEVPITIEAPDQLLVVVGGSEARQAVDAVERTPRQTGIGLGIAASAAGLSLLLARRRSTMLIWLGASTAAAVGVVHLVVNSVVPAALDDIEPTTDLAMSVQQRLADAALVSLDQWLILTAMVAAGAVLVGVAARGMGR